MRRRDSGGKLFKRFVLFFFLSLFLCFFSSSFPFRSCSLFATPCAFFLITLVCPFFSISSSCTAHFFIPCAFFYLSFFFLFSYPLCFPFRSVYICFSLLPLSACSFVPLFATCFRFSSFSLVPHSHAYISRPLLYLFIFSTFIYCTTLWVPLKKYHATVAFKLMSMAQEN